jgi:hypothetical protein
MSRFHKGSQSKSGSGVLNGRFRTEDTGTPSVFQTGAGGFADRVTSRAGEAAPVELPP